MCSSAGVGEIRVVSICDKLSGSGCMGVSGSAMFSAFLGLCSKGSVGLLREDCLEIISPILSPVCCSSVSKLIFPASRISSIAS